MMFPLDPDRVYDEYEDGLAFADALFSEYPDAPFTEEAVEVIYDEMVEHDEPLSYDDLCYLFVEYDSYEDFCEEYGLDPSLPEEEHEWFWDKQPFSYMGVGYGHILLIR